jgi:hypothetical protein
VHEKSRPRHTAKKPGKTLKQKRAAKRASAAALVPKSVVPPTGTH